MAKKNITYSELPEFLFDETRALDIVRKEFTIISRTAERYGFDRYSRIESGELARFIDSKLYELSLMNDSSESIDLSDLADEILLCSGKRPASIQETIETAARLIKVLRDTRSMFGEDILSIINDKD